MKRSTVAEKSGVVIIESGWDEGYTIKVLSANTLASRLFPAVPAGRAASFQSLRVPGAVLVSAARNRAGVEWIAVRAEGAGEVAVALPWRGAAIVPQPPDLRLDPAGPSLRWTAAAGTLYRLTPTA